MTTDAALRVIAGEQKTIIVMAPRSPLSVALSRPYHSEVTRIGMDETLRVILGPAVLVHHVTKEKGKRPSAKYERRWNFLNGSNNYKITNELHLYMPERNLVSAKLLLYNNHLRSYYG